MADAQRLGEFVRGNDRRVSSSALQIAKILLAESGTRFNLFLSQALFPTQAGEIPADQRAHVDADLAIIRKEMTEDPFLKNIIPRWPATQTRIHGDRTGLDSSDRYS